MNLGSECNKVCITCGENKPISEFSKHRNTKEPFDECKLCRHRKASATHRRDIRINHPVIYETLKSVARDRAKKKHRCAKMFCPTIPQEKIIKLICPVCKTEFGVTTAEYNGSMNYFGRPPKYCGQPCYWKSLTKSWREKSDYAIKIKQLVKEYGNK